MNPQGWGCLSDLKPKMNQQIMAYVWVHMALSIKNTASVKTTTYLYLSVNLGLMVENDFPPSAYPLNPTSLRVS